MNHSGVQCTKLYLIYFTSNYVRERSSSKICLIRAGNPNPDAIVPHTILTSHLESPQGDFLHHESIYLYIGQPIQNDLREFKLAIMSAC